jgi:hypothetical protein
LNQEPRILFIDIETAPIIMAAWQTYEANAVWVERDTYILSFAAKWSDGKVKTYALPDYPRYKTHKHDDRHLVAELWKMLEAAHIVVAHNGISFDLKKIRARMAVHRMKPCSGFRVVDTLRESRKHFKFDSNKLDNLGRYLQEGRKIPNSGAHLWRGCCNGDAKSWRIMRRYNAQDVLLLERVYERLKPWMTTHPNVNLYTGRNACPSCQSTRFKGAGLHYLQTTKRQRFKCLDCGKKWCGDIVREGTCQSQSDASRSAATSRATVRRRATTASRARRTTNRSRPASAKTSRRKR